MRFDNRRRSTPRTGPRRHEGSDKETAEDLPSRANAVAVLVCEEAL